MKTYIPVIMTREIIKLDVKDIFYVEQNLRKTKFCTENNTYENYSKIGDYLCYMDENFLKCHRSLYVNMDNVVAMREQSILFKNGLSVHLGRDNFTAAKQRFIRYITGNK